MKLQESILVSTIILMVIAIAPAQAATKSIDVKGSGTSTYVTSDFSFDGVRNANSVTAIGSDNIGGSFHGHNVSEYSPTSTTCTAPDGSAGTVFDLVALAGVRTYNTGQIFLSASGASAGSLCVSNTTGSEHGTFTSRVTGGSGKYAAASGTETTSFTNELLANGKLTGGSGEFGATQFTVTGSVTP